MGIGADNNPGEASLASTEVRFAGRSWKKETTWFCLPNVSDADSRNIGLSVAVVVQKVVFVHIWMGSFNYCQKPFMPPLVPSFHYAADPKRRTWCGPRGFVRNLVVPVGLTVLGRELDPFVAFRSTGQTAALESLQHDLTVAPGLGRCVLQPVPFYGLPHDRPVAQRLYKRSRWGRHE